MPSVHKHPKSKFYQAFFVDADGVRVSRSTKQTKKGKAMRVAIAYEDAARAARNGNATAVQMRKVIEGTLKSISDDAPLLHTIADWCNSWVAGKIASKSKGTAERYGPEMEEFLAHIGSKANKDLSLLTKIDVQGNRDRKVKEGLANASANLSVKMLRSCFGLAVRQGLITSNPADAVELLPKEATNKRPFTRAELDRIIAACPDEEWVGMLRVGYYVGPRISNAARICHEDVEYEQALLTYTPVKQQNNGVPKKLQIPVHPELMEFFRARRKISGPIFPSLCKKKTGGKTGLSLTFRAILEKAAIECAVKTPKGQRGRKVYAVGYHSLRHTFNSDLANLQVTQEVRQKLIGHASETVNDGYTHFELQTLREAIDRLPRLDQPIASKPEGNQEPMT